jgi:hypothetical protein
MADAFASVAVAAVGGLGAEEWLKRNYVLDSLLGDDLIEAYTLQDPCVSLGMLKRKECAILLHDPQKWRANSALSWYYSVTLTPTSAESAVSGRLRVVRYHDAMLMTTGAADGPAVVVVPLFAQATRPPRGSRFALPLQFACDAVTAGAGGLAYRDDHISVGYFNALQTLCHHAAEAPEEALPQWLSVMGFLLADLEHYSGQLPDVQAIVEHLRGTLRWAEGSRCRGSATTLSSSFVLPPSSPLPSLQLLSSHQTCSSAPLASSSRGSLSTARSACGSLRRP